MTINEIATVYAEMIRATIEHRRAGNNEAAYSIQEMVIRRSGCQLWELIEAEQIVNESKFAGEDPRRVAATPIKRESGPKPYAAADNNIEGQILAKQERDNADAYM